LFKYVADIFIENPNKSNLIHSCFLDLFDFLSKEYNKKLGLYLMQNFEATLFKNPSYENMFKKFVEMYEGKDETKKADQGDPLNNY
jgi:hypothetical protein